MRSVSHELQNITDKKRGSLQLINPEVTLIMLITLMLQIDPIMRLKSSCKNPLRISIT